MDKLGRRRLLVKLEMDRDKEMVVIDSIIVQVVKDCKESFLSCQVMFVLIG